MKRTRALCWTLSCTIGAIASSRSSCMVNACCLGDDDVERAGGGGPERYRGTISQGGAVADEVVLSSRRVAAGAKGAVPRPGSQRVCAGRSSSEVGATVVFVPKPEATGATRG